MWRPRVVECCIMMFVIGTQVCARLSLYYRLKKICYVACPLLLHEEEVLHKTRYLELEVMLRPHFSGSESGASDHA